MRPNEQVDRTELYECFECGGRRSEPDLGVCGSCGGELRNISRERDF